MHIAFGGAAVADERHGHRVFAEPLCGHRGADGVQTVRPDVDRDWRTMFLGEAQTAVPAAPPHRADLGRRDAADQQGAELPVLREQPVGLAQTCCRAHLCGFLTAARGEQRKFTLPLQIDEFDVEVAGEDHLLVQPAQCFGRQVAAISLVGGGRAVGRDELHGLKVHPVVQARDRHVSHTASFR